jgi:hypothetical protein
MVVRALAVKGGPGGRVKAGCTTVITCPNSGIVTIVRVVDMSFAE